MENIIAPSLLAANFSNLEKDVQMINNSAADWFHLDIMDGVFVPNISFGFPVLEAISKQAKKPMDVHLMIVDPDKFVPQFQKLGTYMLTVHYEACTHLHRSVQLIKSHGMKAGVALNPHTPVEVLEDILPEIDMVLVMSVNPGFGAQSFIENSLDKIARLKKMIERKGLNTLIQVDGGVNIDTGKKLLESGANVLVSGSFIFGAENPTAVVEKFKAL